MKDQFKILRPYYRGLPLIILSMIAFYLLAIKYLTYVVPMYESTAKIKLADTNEGVSNNNLFKDLDVFTSTNKIATEIDVFKSHVLLSKCIKYLSLDTEINRVGKLKTVSLYDKSPIQIEFIKTEELDFDKFFQLNISEIQELSISYENKLLAKGYFNDTIILNNTIVKIGIDSPFIQRNQTIDIEGDYEFKKRSESSLIKDIQENLDVNSVDKDVPVIRVRYKSNNPKKAALIANKLVQAYIDDYIETRYLASTTTVKFLDKQIANINRKLSKSENNIQNYREKYGITNVRQESETELRKIAQLKIQLTNLKMSLDAMQNLENYINSNQDDFLSLAPNFEAFTDLLSTELIKNIKALQSEKKDLLIQYTPSHELVKTVEAKIKDHTSYLIESIKNTRNNLQVKHYSLIDDIAKAEEGLIPIPENEKALKTLDREFQLFQNSYVFLNEKKIEAQISQASKIAFHRIISPAEIAKEPMSPNRTIIKIVSALLGMFLALLFIFIVHLLKAKVNSKENIEANSMIPVTSLTPKLKKDVDINSHFQQKAIEFELKKLVKNGDLITFNSFNKNEGASFNGFHVAKAYAHQCKKTLIIDFDNTLQLFSDSDFNKLALSENLDVCSINFDKHQQTSKESFKKILQVLSDGYDITIVISENLKHKFALIAISEAATNFVVLDARKTSADKIIEVDLLKEEFNFSNLHFVLNRDKYNPNVLVESVGFVKSILSVKIFKN
jgi:uncharacterized protein involved in exopolysaccharide biosynthesis